MGDAVEEELLELLTCHRPVSLKHSVPAVLNGVPYTTTYTEWGSGVTIGLPMYSLALYNECLCQLFNSFVVYHREPMICMDSIKAIANGIT